jgi:hypothetical protein
MTQTLTRMNKTGFARKPGNCENLDMPLFLSRSWPAGQSGPGRPGEVCSGQPRRSTRPASGDGNSDVGLSAALEDAEKRSQSAYQTRHAQEPAKGDSARSSAAPGAQHRLKDCIVPMT